MDIKIITNISKSNKEIKVTIDAPENNSYAQRIARMFQETLLNTDAIPAKQDNKIYLVKLKEIISFYSENSITYLRTPKSTLKTSYRLYELEKILNNGFIRISNQCIVNKEYIDYFDVNITGDLMVKLKDKTMEYVSKRRVKSVMEMLRRK